MKFEKYKFSCKIKLKKTPQSDDRLVYQIKVLKIMCLFSQNEYDLESIKNETKMVFRISENDNWNDLPLLHGTALVLNNFSVDVIDAQKSESVVYLFNELQEFAALKIICGLVLDGLVDTSILNLSRHNSVYFSNDGCCNCKIFPINWMEIFTNGVIGQKENEKGDAKTTKIKTKMTILKSFLIKKDNNQNQTRSPQVTYKTPKIGLGGNLSSRAKIATAELKTSNTQIKLNSSLKVNEKQANKVNHQKTPRNLKLQSERCKKTTNNPVEFDRNKCLLLINDLSRSLNKTFGLKENDDKLYQNYMTSFRIRGNDLQLNG